MTDKKFEYTGVTEQDVEYLKDRVKKLNKRARKLNCPEMTVEVKNERPYKVYNDLLGNFLANPYWIKIYDFEIHGDTPKYDGWEFLASITGYPNGQNIVHKAPFAGEDVDVSKYRNEKSFCDHCKTHRYRKYTYLVMKEETGEIYQVGSTCIKDFLGHSAPGFGFMAKVIEELDDPDLAGLKGYTGIRYQSLSEFLPYACEVIAQNGFTSKKKAEELMTASTADAVDHIYNVHNNSVMWEYATQEERNFKISNDSYKMAENIIEWGRKIGERENLNDFMYSLSVLFNNDIFEPRALGIVVASVNVYRNEMGLNEEKKKGFNPKNSEYFGEVKKRYELTLTLTKILDFENDWGKVNMHIFFDDDENQFVWFANNTEIKIKGDDRFVEIGDKIKVKATVKKHKEYKEMKQTVINRVTGLEFVEKKEE